MNKTPKNVLTNYEREKKKFNINEWRSWPYMMSLRRRPEMLEPERQTIINFSRPQKYTIIHEKKHMIIKCG